MNSSGSEQWWGGGDDYSAYHSIHLHNLLQSQIAISLR